MIVSFGVDMSFCPKYGVTHILLCNATFSLALEVLVGRIGTGRGTSVVDNCATSRVLKKSWNFKYYNLLIDQFDPNDFKDLV